MRARTLARLGAGGCALVLCGAGWAAFAPTADAVTGIQTGYWSSLPATPQVPSNGLEIGSDASGPHALAALRFTLSDGESSPVLTLKVAQAQPQAQIVIEACAVATASANWATPPGGGPGAMTSAPAANCTGGLVTGVVAADGTTVTFDLSGIPAEGAVMDVVLQPGQVASPAAGTVPGAPDQIYPTFDAAFQPVVAGQIAVQAGPTTTTGAPPPAGTSSGGGAYAAPPPASAPQPAGQIALPPATSTDTNAGVAPVIASPQPTNVAATAPTYLTKKRNLRLLFGVALLSSDLLFALLWLERKLPGAQERPLISLYDPPPVPSS
jgi:hypothetical protein